MTIKPHILTVTLLTATIHASNGQPVFTQQPASQSVSLGANPQFNSAATSTNSAVTYQWRLESTNLLARTNSSLNLTNVNLASAGDYDAVATDAIGSATSMWPTWRLMQPSQRSLREAL